MHDKYKSYKRTHDTQDVEKVELEKIHNNKVAVNKANRKLKKGFDHKLSGDDYYEENQQALYDMKKKQGTLRNHRKRLQNFKENDHL